MPAPRVWTIGHSTRSADAFIELLRESRIGTIADVRTIPGSRRHPHFARERLAALLEEAGIGYRHFPSLGGLRKPHPESLNSGWKNAAFRGYADHMQTRDFTAGLDALLAIAAETAVAVMCAEAVWWRCHRMLLADALTARGSEVTHILSDTGTKHQPHRLTPFARIREDTTVWYPGVI